MNLKNNEVTVSIICTVYNHEKYIEKTLLGFVSQQTNFVFEAIIHDDASKDGSSSIIKKYAAKYPDIIKPIYESENQWSKHDGSIARIIKTRLKGKYIAICEGDDCWIDSNKLQKQVDFMESHPNCTLCGHNAIILKDNKRTSPFYRFKQDKYLSLKYCVDNWAFPTASLLVRANAYFWRPDWLVSIYSGDLSLIIKCRILGDVYAFHDFMSIYRYNTTGESSTARMAKKNIYVYKQWINLFNSFNKGSNYQYSNIFNSKITFLKHLIKYHELKENKQKYKIIFYPKIVYILLGIKLSQTIEYLKKEPRYPISIEEFKSK